MKLSLSICQQFSYNRFSKVAHNIFFKFCMKLEDFKGQKLRTKFFRKIIILRKKPENSKIWFSNYHPTCSFPIRLRDSSVINISKMDQLISCSHQRNHQSSRKGSISNYLFRLSVASCTSCPFRLPDSLIINIFEKSQLVS